MLGNRHTQKQKRYNTAVRKEANGQDIFFIHNLSQRSEQFYLVNSTSIF
jgi:hypothetical protein